MTIPTKIPTFVLICGLSATGCNPELGGTRPLDRPDAQQDALSADQGADQGQGPESRGVEPRPDAMTPDAAVDASPPKQDGEPCAVGAECRSFVCYGGVCGLLPNGAACGPDWTCLSGYCRGNRCDYPPCLDQSDLPNDSCMVRPDGGGACMSTCGQGRICCPGGCRTPVDGGIKPDAGDHCF